MVSTNSTFCSIDGHSAGNNHKVSFLLMYSNTQHNCCLLVSPKTCGYLLNNGTCLHHKISCCLYLIICQEQCRVLSFQRKITTHFSRDKEALIPLGFWGRLCTDDGGAHISFGNTTATGLTVLNRAYRCFSQVWKEFCTECSYSNSHSHWCCPSLTVQWQ